MREGGISIWFFIGVCLLVMGAMILGTGIFELVSPPPVPSRVVLYSMHAPIWWGALLVALGAFYTLHFRPGRHHATR